MGCRHCGAVVRQGRYCVGCGRRVWPQLQPMGSRRAAAQPPAVVADDLTQPVLRLPRRSRPEVPQPHGA